MDQSQLKKSFVRRFWWVFLIIALIVISLLFICLRNKKTENKSTGNDKKFDSSRRELNHYQDIVWVPDALTQPLQKEASTTRLSLPFKISELSQQGNPFYGFGGHTGAHIEGLDHSYTQIVGGVPDRAWGNGTVTEVTHQNEEYMIRIDYGNGLECVLGEVKTSLVQKDQKVKYYDEIAIPNTKEKDGNGNEEMYCYDRNLTSGIYTSNGSPYTIAVSPFDYLVETDKVTLAKYFDETIYPYYRSKNGSLSDFSITEPYLTNQILFHKSNKLDGAWFLQSKKWETGDMVNLTFIDVSNQFYKGQVVHYRLQNEEMSDFQGTFETNYSGNGGEIVMTGHTLGSNDKPVKKYAKFEITQNTGKDTDGVAVDQMKFEMGDQPIVTFSAGAQIYQVRGPWNPYYDAQNMGLYDEK